jgi:response regulator RpfG family c-di-GMP phosphodiesterase
MKPTILVADDVGACFKEVGKAFAGRNILVDRAVSLEDCVDKCRASLPKVLLVFAGMSRAFSLLRIVRRSEDLGQIPLIVAGEPEQEELMAKHRKLPSRADRYLLRPLDLELVRSVFAEFLGKGAHDDIRIDEKTPPPLPVRKGAQAVADAPDAYSRVQDELRNYQSRVKELEQDLAALSKVSKENASLREEVVRLRAEAAVPAGAVGESSEDYNDLFARLEVGYKETIDDMERLVQEKDQIIARLAASDGGGEDLQTLTKELEREKERYQESVKALRQALGLLDDMARSEAEVGLEDLLAKLEEMVEQADALASSFGFDEETVIVDAATIAKGVTTD